MTWLIRLPAGAYSRAPLFFTLATVTSVGYASLGVTGLLTPATAVT